jgi:hypothetical protein
MYTKVRSRMAILQCVRNTFSHPKPQSNWGTTAMVRLWPATLRCLLACTCYLPIVLFSISISSLVLIHQPKASSSSASSKARGKRQRTGPQRSTARSGRPKSPGVPDSVRQNIRAAIDSLLELGRESKREKKDGKPSCTSCWGTAIPKHSRDCYDHCTLLDPSTPPPTAGVPTSVDVQDSGWLS